VGLYLHVQQVPRAYLLLTWTAPTYSQHILHIFRNARAVTTIHPKPTLTPYTPCRHQRRSRSRTPYCMSALDPQAPTPQCWPPVHSCSHLRPISNKVHVSDRVSQLRRRANCARPSIRSGGLVLMCGAEGRKVRVQAVGRPCLGER
jgi:hypothetical protein